MILGQVKMSQSSLFLLRLLFFLNKSSLNYCKSLCNFQCCENRGFDNFCQCSYCFYEGTDFWRSLIFYFGSVPPLILLHLFFPPCFTLPIWELLYIFNIQLIYYFFSDSLSDFSPYTTTFFVFICFEYSSFIPLVMILCLSIFPLRLWDIWDCF